MVTLFHREKNTLGKYTFAYHAFLFKENQLFAEQKDFPAMTDGEIWFKTIKIDAYLANLEKILTGFKFTEHTFEVTNALDRCRKGLKWACENNRDFDALAKMMPKINVFLIALLQGVDPEDFLEVKMYITIITNFTW